MLKEFGVNNWNLFLDPAHPEYESAVAFARSKKDVNLTIRSYDELESFLKTCRAIACHNLFGYDLRLWKKLSGIEYDMFKDPKCMGTIGDTQVNLYDTLSMSRVLYPDRPLPNGCPDSVLNPVTGKRDRVGPHGLLAWGYRVANKKVQIDDWRNQPLWEYVNRVWEDVLINELTWQSLIDESTGARWPDDKQFMYKDKPEGMRQINWKNALRRRMLTDYLMIEQEIQGVPFNKHEAEKLRDRIDVMMKEIEEEVEPQLPLKEMTKSQQPKFPANPFDGAGRISHHGWNWLEYKLGYPVNREALEFKGPPKTAFKGNGDVSAAGERYCIQNGVEDPAAMPDFIRSQIKKENTLVPLPPDLMEKAIADLRAGKMPDLMVPMKISNQDDIKKYLIRDAGWKPTLWRVKDVTKDQFKKTRDDAEIDGLVRKYIEELGESEYKSLILEHLNNSDAKFNISENKFDHRHGSDRVYEEIFKKFRRKARQLPTSPQLKDNFGKLCPNLEVIDVHLAKQIVKWLSLRNRRSVLDPIDEDKNDTGLLNHPRLAIDGKLPARFSGITNTGRCKHTICANMPKPDPKVLLGKEMRGLWGVTDEYYQVGIDGSNLEGMIAAWGAYQFDGGEYLRIMESGDAHARNAEAYTKASGTLVTRNGGKGVTYGIMYGAQAAKIAAMLHISLDKAQAVIDAFWDSNFGLKGRKEWLENFWEATGKRYIPGLDGRKIWTRSKHSLLNAFQQNGGASLFDLVGILLHWELIKRGWYDDDVRRLIYYHDEYQLQVPKKYLKKWEFDTLEEATAFVKEWEAKGRVFDGHEWRKAVKDENGDKVKDAEGNTVYEGIFGEDGKIHIQYCPVGEMVVRCVEKAARIMGSPVHITGAYLTGANWAQCH
nr:MAG: DNA polymerase family A [Bacteriophage sp.]